VLEWTLEVYVMQNYWLGDYYMNILNSQEQFRAVLDQYLECPDDEDSKVKLSGVLHRLLDIMIENFPHPLEIGLAGCSCIVNDCLAVARKCDCSPAKFFGVVILKNLKKLQQPTSPPSDKDYNWSATFDGIGYHFTIPVHPYNLPQKLAAQEDVELMILNNGSEKFSMFSRWLSSSYKHPTPLEITIHCHDKYGKSRGSVSLQDANHIEVSMIDPEYFSSSILGMELKFKYGKAKYDDEEFLARHGQRREEA
jgi:hypothetical protein